MSAIVNGEGGVIINGVSGGGGASLPDTPANVLLDLANAGDVVGLDPVTGVGATVGMDLVVDSGATMILLAGGPAPAGATLVYDGSGAMVSSSATVSALLAATALPFTSVVNAVEHTTNNGSTYHLLTISCAQASRGYTFRGTISATKSDFTNAYAWDVIATVSHDGSVTLRDAVITPTDPSGPYSVVVDTNGSNLRVGVVGVAATNVKWHGGGFLTQYGA